MSLNNEFRFVLECVDIMIHLCIPTAPRNLPSQVSRLMFTVDADPLLLRMLRSVLRVDDNQVRHGHEACLTWPRRVLAPLSEY